MVVARAARLALARVVARARVVVRPLRVRLSHHDDDDVVDEDIVIDIALVIDVRARVGVEMCARLGVRCARTLSPSPASSSSSSAMSCLKITHVLSH